MIAKLEHIHAIFSRDSSIDLTEGQVVTIDAEKSSIENGLYVKIASREDKPFGLVQLYNNYSKSNEVRLLPLDNIFYTSHYDKTVIFKILDNLYTGENGIITNKYEIFNSTAIYNSIGKLLKIENKLLVFMR